MPPSALDCDARFDAWCLAARPVVYSFRYCEACRQEWPARQQSCPLCRRWLGDQPQRRTEWQIVPERNHATLLSRATARAEDWILVGASTFVLRALSARPPESALGRCKAVLRAILQVQDARGEAAYRLCPIADQGWLLTATRGLRPAFIEALGLEQRLRAVLPQLVAIIGGRIRFGIWLDQYLLPCDEADELKVSTTLARTLFDFEPDDLLLSSEQTYQANRRFENFVCIPRRLLGGEEVHGYRFLEHKRPSARDHAELPDLTPFVGRAEDLSFLDSSLQASHAAPLSVALIAEAGSGKTRLIREWRRRHPDLRVLSASFSLFGGDLAEFAAQFVGPPAGACDRAALQAAILERIAAGRTEVLVFDDLHWADGETAAFLLALLDFAPRCRRLVLLLTRPSGRAVLKPFRPAIERVLSPLPKPSLRDLAQKLIPSEPVAAIAIERAGGNPLFIEQFAAWAAESGFAGEGEAPRNLHQVIAARIMLLSKVRLGNVRRTLPWVGQPNAIRSELDGLEREIGLWLDRLETADYGDRCEVARHLVALERIDFELFVARMLAGHPRPRSGRLTEAIERLLTGSRDAILADLRARVPSASAAERAEIHGQAERAAEVLMQRFHWEEARDFLALARDVAEPWQRPSTANRLRSCEQRLPGAPIDEAAILAANDPDARPAVDALQLPGVWARLGLQSGSASCFRRAAAAAEAINDQALALWAREKAHQATRLSSRAVQALRT